MSEHSAQRHQRLLDPAPDRAATGLPLANGLLGAMLWNEGADLIVSLDRTDLWDLREVPEFSGPEYRYEILAGLVEAGDIDEIVTRYEGPYRKPAPTKLPGGRIRLSGAAAKQATHDYFAAMATSGAGSSAVHAVVEAEAPSGVLWGTGEPRPITLEAPAYGRPTPDRPPDLISKFGPEDLDYELPRFIRETNASGYVQDLPDGTACCALVGWIAELNQWRAIWTIALASDGAAAEAEARRIVAERLNAGLQPQLEAHRHWWKAEWSRVDLALPDADIESLWVEESYKFIAAARPDCPPVALQGPWTLDNGRLPPWKGDYHHDLNTQMTYWPALTGNRLEAHRGFLDWLWDTRNECRRWTRLFYGLDGLAVPMTADLRNRQLGGWAPHTHSATSGAWLAHHFTAHWRMSADAEFLEQRAYPYVRESAEFLDALTRRDADKGRRRLRLSSSPEIGNNQLEAWFDDWTNYDLALTRDLIASAAEMAEVLGLGDDKARWSALLTELPELALDQEGGLAVAPGHALADSHRHFSHQLAFHPLRRITPGDPVIAPTVARIEKLGFDNWMGYTFSWMAGLYAAVGQGDMAVRMLNHFRNGFRLPCNGFHTNGEIGHEKLTRWPFEAFTFEGNCAAMAAIQDMLLQSDQNGLHIFPALPADWRTASFHGLLAMGAVTVSASLADDRVELLLLCPNDRSIELRIGGDRPVPVKLAAGQECRMTTGWKAELQ